MGIGTPLIIGREGQDIFNRRGTGASVMEALAYHQVATPAPGASYWTQQVAKRVFDIVAAGLLLIVLWPVLLVAALMVRASSSGPILFRQERIGRQGKPFTLYKFRTMVHNSDATVHLAHMRALINGDAQPVNGTFKLLKDTRITPLGRILRRFSLDELPQLFNVLEGTMSLVGPRPALPYEVELYGARERQRLAVAPGITGLWQVSGRAELNFDQSISYDLAYIEHWSFTLDLAIIGQTPHAVLSGRGAC
jgi:lipopolysaccharide/colanic/teichoic acid biosynthesis glycosyltransferase